MSKTHRVCDCPFPMHESQLDEIEAKAEELGISSTYIFSVVLEEGLERMSRD